jgi:hypothetical protein
MAKRTDIRISNALAINIHGAANPLDMMTENAGVSPNVHGAAGELLAAPTNEEGQQIVCVHGACVVQLDSPHIVSRVEVTRGPDGELMITLHE